MLRGSRAIVTGASRGIGYAIAKMLAGAGCEVVITGRNLAALEKAAREIGGRVTPMAWDMVNVAESKKHILLAAEQMGGMDILVNNAGIFAQRSEWDDDNLLNTTEDEWQRVIDTNLTALFFSMQTAVRTMLEHGIRGNILNVTSVAGYEPVNGAYGASKIAASSLTRGWGKRFAPRGIVINGIAPGPVATEMNNWHEGDPMDNPRIPYGRYATIDEIAQLAMYLLSEEAQMVCGETVVLDGGYAIR